MYCIEFLSPLHPPLPSPSLSLPRSLPLPSSQSLCSSISLPLPFKPYISLFLTSLPPSHPTFFQYSLPPSNSLTLLQSLFPSINSLFNPFPNPSLKPSFLPPSLLQILIFPSLGTWFYQLSIHSEVGAGRDRVMSDRSIYFMDNPPPPFPRFYREILLERRSRALMYTLSRIDHHVHFKFKYIKMVI